YTVVYTLYLHDALPISFLNLIPIFFGASPNGLIEKAANKKNFVDYYLPSSRSMVIFEYLAHSGTKCVVLYRNNNQGKHNYRFVRSEEHTSELQSRENLV